MGSKKRSIFTVDEFQFPYDYTFPGKSRQEELLFAVRENKSVLYARLLGAAFFGLFGVMVTWGLIWAIGAALGLAGASFALLMTGLIVAITLLAMWWIYRLWNDSIAVLTTKRLAKFIATTPFNRHSLSLPLEQVVDTGAYTKGFLQAIFRLGTFTARSAAASSGVATDDPQRINKKYFYIENVAAAEDLQHYVNKLLYNYRHEADRLEDFRPFIPELKGEARKRFMEEWPRYWS
jgi:hypothetical protein